MMMIIISFIIQGSIFSRNASVAEQMSETNN